jgi:hypothetical protein
MGTALRLLLLLLAVAMAMLMAMLMGMADTMMALRVLLMNTKALLTTGMLLQVRKHLYCTVVILKPGCFTKTGSGHPLETLR